MNIESKKGFKGGKLS